MYRWVRAVSDRSSDAIVSSRVVAIASLVFLGVFPLLVLIALFASAVADDRVAFDLRPVYAAAEAILDGESPYPSDEDSLTATGAPYVYPPVPALLALPATRIPVDAAGLILMIALAVVAFAIPFVLGVRDWRCYGLLLLWPPVIVAIQTGNVTLWIGLAAALVWRYRERSLVSAAGVGVTLAVKFLLWPLLLWLAATRRVGTAIVSCGITAALLFLSWAAIGFRGIAEYPGLLKRLEETVGPDAYTIDNLIGDLGAGPAFARIVWLAVGLGLLVAVILLGRRGDERSAFIVALAAALALSPLVWLHYFALLVVIVAVAQPRLGPVWFLPLVMFLAPGRGDPTAIETFVVLGAAGLTVGLSLRTTLGGVSLSRSRPSPTALSTESA
jgi:alpha-1,2-mannosyltransferase